MAAYIILGLSLGLPLLLGLAFRVGAPHLFFSVMAGELLARYFGHDVGKIAESVLPPESATAYAESVILIAPMLLTAYFLHGSLSKGKTMLHILPLVVTGVVLASFLLPMLPETLKVYVRSVPLGLQLLDINRFIIGTVIIFQLVALWWLNRGHEKGLKHK